MAFYASGIDFVDPASPGELEAIVDYSIEEWKEVRKTAMGYPRNWLVHSVVQKLMEKAGEFGVHNVGDWEGGSRFAPSAFAYEYEVMLFFMELFNCTGGEDNFWGYIDASGSSGNLWTTTVGIKALEKNNGRSLVMIFSEAAHYSFHTAVLQSGRTAEIVAANDDGTVNIDKLKEAFDKHSNSPIWMGILCGGTVKEGRDNIRAVLEAARNTGRPPSDFFFHVDGAFSAVPLALMSESEDADITPNFDLDVGGFKIDSLSISTHKFIGTLDTGGMILMRKEHSDAIAIDVSYIQAVSKTQIGSRNARSIIECWALIKYLGREVLTQWAIACAERARTLRNEMSQAGIEGLLLNRNAFTIYCKEFSSNLSEKHRLAPENGYVHVIVTPHTLHPSQLGKNREGEPFKSFDTANTFINAVREELA